MNWNATNCDDFSNNTNPFSGSNYSNINTFNFGSTATRIPAYLCYNLSSLTSLTITYSVTSIGSYAFNLCGGLTKIYAALNPDRVQLGLKVFEGVSYNTCNLHVQENHW
ncbi:MAG: leucine-rich repeat protein [Muribaculaceae bacterium]|nr:leucine-rich repeat protein [Muribaculaceae bacterium]